MATKKTPAKKSSKPAAEAKPKNQEEATQEVNTPTIPENAEQPAETGIENPTQGVVSQEPTDEQKAYVTAFNRYLELHGVLPDNKLSRKQIESANAKRQEEIDNPTAAKAVTAPPAKQGIAKPDKRYVILKNKNNGEVRRVKRVTWELLKNAPAGFEEITDVPQEVKSLKNKK